MPRKAAQPTDNPAQPDPIVPDPVIADPDVPQQEVNPEEVSNPGTPFPDDPSLKNQVSLISGLGLQTMEGDKYAETGR